MILQQAQFRWISNPQYVSPSEPPPPPPDHVPRRARRTQAPARTKSEAPAPGLRAVPQPQSIHQLVGVPVGWVCDGCGQVHIDYADSGITINLEGFGSYKPELEIEGHKQITNRGPLQAPIFRFCASSSKACSRLADPSGSARSQTSTIWELWHEARVRMAKDLLTRYQAWQLGLAEPSQDEAEQGTACEFALQINAWMRTSIGGHSVIPASGHGQTAREILEVAGLTWRQTDTIFRQVGGQPVMAKRYTRSVLLGAGTSMGGACHHFRDRNDWCDDDTQLEVSSANLRQGVFAFLKCEPDFIVTEPMLLLFKPYS